MEEIQYPSNRVLMWTRPSNLLCITMDAPIATRNSSGDMGVGNYSLKSRPLPPLQALVLSKYSLNNRADHRLSKVDFETEVGLIIVVRRGIR